MFLFIFEAISAVSLTPWKRSHLCATIFSNRVKNSAIYKRYKLICVDPALCGLARDFLLHLYVDGSATWYTTLVSSTVLTTVLSDPLLL
jgi:hypothetical protein